MREKSNAEEKSVKLEREVIALKEKMTKDTQRSFSNIEKIESECNKLKARLEQYEAKIKQMTQRESQLMGELNRRERLCNELEEALNKKNSSFSNITNRDLPGLNGFSKGMNLTYTLNPLKRENTQCELNKETQDVNKRALDALGAMLSKNQNALRTALSAINTEIESLKQIVKVFYNELKSLYNSTIQNFEDEELLQDEENQIGKENLASSSHHKAGSSSIHNKCEVQEIYKFEHNDLEADLSSKEYKNIQVNIENNFKILHQVLSARSHIIELSDFQSDREKDRKVFDLFQGYKSIATTSMNLLEAISLSKAFKSRDFDSLEEELRSKICRLKALNQDISNSDDLLSRRLINKRTDISSKHKEKSEKQARSFIESLEKDIDYYLKSLSLIENETY